MDPAEFFAFFDLWKWENPFRIIDFRTGLYAPLIVPQSRDGLLLLPPPKKAVTISSLGLRNSISQFSVNTSTIIQK